MIVLGLPTIATTTIGRITVTTETAGAGIGAAAYMVEIAEAEVTHRVGILALNTHAMLVMTAAALDRLIIIGPVIPRAAAPGARWPPR